ncbi:MAG TPA: TlpA disulfide reductase family protein [Mycobacteriales bacterium]|nr:TlpA disulfide reductase family protein [Mycobacteriales bacterium]
MPRIQLPCMDGSGRSLTLGRPLGLPTVINLWGSWCPPCGRELPAFVSLQKTVAGKAVVMGVVTEDSANRSVDAAHELGVQFPNLYDRHGELRRRLGISALPATLFVAASGELVKTYVGPVLDEAALREQIDHNLGVRLDRAG